MFVVKLLTIEEEKEDFIDDFEETLNDNKTLNYESNNQLNFVISKKPNLQQKKLFSFKSKVLQNYLNINLNIFNFMDFQRDPNYFVQNFQWEKFEENLNKALRPIPKPRFIKSLKKNDKQLVFVKNNSKINDSHSIVKNEDLISKKIFNKKEYPNFEENLNKNDIKMNELFDLKKKCRFSSSAKLCLLPPILRDQINSNTKSFSLIEMNEILKPLSPPNRKKRINNCVEKEEDLCCFNAVESDSLKTLVKIPPLLTPTTYYRKRQQFQKPLKKFANIFEENQKFYSKNFISENFINSKRQILRIFVNPINMVISKIVLFYVLCSV